MTSPIRCISSYLTEVVGQLYWDSEQLYCLHRELITLFARVLETVGRHGLVGQHGDLSDHFVKRVGEVIAGFEGFGGAFQAPVTGGDFSVDMGCAFGDFGFAEAAAIAIWLVSTQNGAFHLWGRECEEPALVVSVAMGRANFTKQSQKY